VYILVGIHDEGQLIKSMFLLCFWDIIYDSYPSYILFISQYQDCPLDWRSRHFYNIREQRIKVKIMQCFSLIIVFLDNKLMLVYFEKNLGPNGGVKTNDC
jgi:hypothetical protein